MAEDLTFYHKKRKTRGTEVDEYVISKQKSENASDFFLFLPYNRSIKSIDDALEYVKNNSDLKKIDGLPEHHRKILTSILTSLERSQLLDTMGLHDANKDSIQKQNKK